MIKRLALATENPHKVREFSDLLGPHGWEVIASTGIVFPEETGTTFTDNAYEKAKTVCLATGMPALADDSGIVIDALGGAPGVYSARYAGLTHGSRDEIDRANIKKVLDAMQGRTDRTARFVCALVCTFPDHTMLTAEGTVEGTIANESHGSHGFGYDPIFVLPDGRTMAELTSEEKHQISHRSRAVQHLIAQLAARQ